MRLSPMRIVLRQDSTGVASTIATLFALLVVLIFMQAAIFLVIPAKQYDAERNTSLQAMAAFNLLRSLASGAAVPGGEFTVTIPVGTQSVSPFSAPSSGDLTFNTGDTTTANVSVQFVPAIHDSHVSKIDQDIILMIDSSGSRAGRSTSAGSAARTASRASTSTASRGSPARMSAASRITCTRSRTPESRTTAGLSRT